MLLKLDSVDLQIVAGIFGSGDLGHHLAAGWLGGVGGAVGARLESRGGFLITRDIQGIGRVGDDRG